MHFIVMWHGCMPGRIGKSNAGAKPIDVMLVVKMLILQHLYHFADEGNENHVRDRLPFMLMRFLGLQLEDRYLTPRRPDCSGNVKDLKLVEVLFNRFTSNWRPMTMRLWQVKW